MLNSFDTNVGATEDPTMLSITIEMSYFFYFLGVNVYFNTTLSGYDYIPNNGQPRSTNTGVLTLGRRNGQMTDADRQGSAVIKWFSVWHQVLTLQEIDLLLQQLG